MNLVKQVTKKLELYGIKIYNEFEMENKGNYVFYLEKMILFVNNNDSSISVTFNVEIRPERSATIALILNQIKNANIHIMEPFILDMKKNEMVSGEKAYKVIENNNKLKLIEEFDRQKIYEEILETEEGYDC